MREVGGSPLVEDVGDGGVTRRYSHEEEEGKRLVGQKREGRVKMTTSYYMDTPINRWIYTCNWQLGIVWGCRIGDGVEYTQLTSEEICWLLLLIGQMGMARCYGAAVPRGRRGCFRAARPRRNCRRVGRSGCRLPDGSTSARKATPALGPSATRASRVRVVQRLFGGRWRWRRGGAGRRASGSG